MSRTTPVSAIGLSLVTALTSVEGRHASVSSLLRLSRLNPSRRISCTNPCTMPTRGREFSDSSRRRERAHSPRVTEDEVRLVGVSFACHSRLSASTLRRHSDKSNPLPVRLLVTRWPSAPSYTSSRTASFDTIDVSTRYRGADLARQLSVSSREIPLRALANDVNGTAILVEMGVFTALRAVIVI
jgi:hypothetical protein